MNLSKIQNSIRKIFLIVFILSSLTFLFNTENLSQKVSAQEDMPFEIYMFYGEGCPHCAKELEYLSILESEYNDRLVIYKFEVYYDQDNGKLFNEASSILGIEVGGVPFLVVGEEGIVGFGSDQTTGVEIQNQINECLKNGCNNPLKDIVHSQYELIQIESDSTIQNPIEENEVSPEVPNNQITIPIFGDINLATLSLPVATFIIAFMDGFNPCAMWILIFLITMLINMEDKKRLYILGSVFIITSGLVYFLFLSAWFNFFKYIGYAYWIKVIIGIVAITSGIIHLKNAFSSKGECHAVDETKRKSIIERIKNITSEKKFGIAIIGIITLAVSVNLIEVVCSAGLPSIYTALLASADLNIGQYYLYLLFYIFIFMLDDLIIFFIAVKTFEVSGITSKYTKWSSIIGGVLIIIIGILLIFKPEVLMFG